MSLRGVIRGRTIELEDDPHLPEGASVEVELRPAIHNPLWGLLAAQPELVQTLRQIVAERSSQPWRTPDEADPA